MTNTTTNLLKEAYDSVIKELAQVAADLCAPALDGENTLLIHHHNPQPTHTHENQIRRRNQHHHQQPTR